MRLIFDVSPCLGCNRVPDPDNCDNKNCMLWRRWFLHRWSGIHSYIRRQMDGPAQREGTGIGGQRYALPHRVRDYLDRDPCTGCSCSSDLCPTPCRARQRWASAHRGC